MDRWIVIGFALVIIAIRTGSQSIGKTTKVAVVGENAHLACPGTVDKKQVNWTSPIGEKLTHGKNVLTFDNRFEVFQISLWYLRINNVSVSDSGDYVCVSNGDHQHVVELTVNETVTDSLVSTTQLLSTTQSPTTQSLTTDPSKCSDTRPCNNSGSCENGSCICPSNFTGTLQPDQEGHTTGTLIGSIIGSFVAGGIIVGVSALCTFYVCRRRHAYIKQADKHGYKNTPVPGGNRPNDNALESISPATYEDLKSRDEKLYSELSISPQLSPPAADFVN